MTFPSKSASPADVLVQCQDIERIGNELLMTMRSRDPVDIYADNIQNCIRLWLIQQGYTPKLKEVMV